jgi:hypothetical protein
MISTSTKEYVCEYYHDGRWWCLNIHAKDDKDAEARVAKLGNLRLLGELGGTIPACLPGARFIVRLLVMLKNRTRILRPHILDSPPDLSHNKTGDRKPQN